MRFVILGVAAVIVVVAARQFLRENRAADIVAEEAVLTGMPNPLPLHVEEEVTTILDDIELLSGAERILQTRNLVRVYVAAGRFDHAANHQRAIAEETEAAEDWRLAGDYYYGWMRYAQSAGGPALAIADHAIDAYENVLETEPNNLDVRTDLATAYLGSSQPMKAVDEIKNVLGRDSTHLEARFNYGVMLAQIGSAGAAVAHFERVMSASSPDSDHYRQAAQAIRAVQP